jgi:hypothetical protein
LKKSELRQIIREEIQRLNEGEASWGIKDKFPIKLTVTLRNGSYRMTPKPMAMSYKTYEHLDKNHRHQDIAVSYGSYDYETGATYFNGKTKEDVDN